MDQKVYEVDPQFDVRDSNGNYKCWSDLHALRYPSVVALGVTYLEFWEMTPNELREVIKAKQNSQVEQINRSLELSWYNARLSALAFHEPKKLPRKPPKVEIKEAEEKIGDMRTMDLMYTLQAMKEAGIEFK